MTKAAATRPDRRARARRMTINAFDERVKHMAATPEARRFQGPVIDVADTMETCKAWFDSREVSYTGSDLIARTKLVLAREREIADGIKRARWEAKHRIGEDA